MKPFGSPPDPKKRARAFCIIFSAFACLVSAVIWWTAETLAFMDYILIIGGPIVFGAVAYLIGLHVSDDAFGA
jgi:sugar phosphate permease